MKPSLFTQSLFSLDLFGAIDATAEIGFSAIELACTSPHLDLETARKKTKEVAGRIRDAGLVVSALSLFNRFADPACLHEQVEQAGAFIRLAPVFGTEIVKLTPGPPASSRATGHHWQSLQNALDALAPLAVENGVRLAVETHMRQLTDTLASSKQLLDTTPARTIGLTVDFSNLSFAGEDMPAVIDAFKGRIFHTHIKNGIIDGAENWHFQALDRGLTDYTEVFPLLLSIGYDGYLSLECLGENARRHPRETAARDLNILTRYISRANPKDAP